MTQAGARLPAAERRRAIVEAALVVFATGSYSGATTAQIAHEAGISEPILYRHFASKRELYFACLDEAWSRLRRTVEEVLAEEADPAAWPMAIPRAVHRLRDVKLLPPHLWIQALSEAGEDDEIRRYLRSHLRAIHAYFTDVLARSQAAGGMPADRDPSAEAWVNLGIGLLRSVQDRLGGIVDEADFTAIGRSRSRWLSGRG